MFGEYNAFDFRLSVESWVAEPTRSAIVDSTLEGQGQVLTTFHHDSAATQPGSGREKRGR
jgi:hypothetical protein